MSFYSMYIFINCIFNNEMPFHFNHSLLYCHFILTIHSFIAVYRGSLFPSFLGYLLPTSFMPKSNCATNDLVFPLITSLEYVFPPCSLARSNSLMYHVFSRTNCFVYMAILNFSVIYLFISSLVLGHSCKLMPHLFI